MECVSDGQLHNDDKQLYACVKPDSKALA